MGSSLEGGTQRRKSAQTLRMLAKGLRLFFVATKQTAIVTTIEHNGFVVVVVGYLCVLVATIAACLVATIL